MPGYPYLKGKKMHNWTNNYIFANGIRIHYTRTGGNKPPLVLLHGFTDSGLSWTPVARALENEYDIIMPDARGHGYSDGPDTGFSIELLATDLAGLIRELQLEQPHLLGHSMGAHTAATFAINHPEQVRSLQLEDPPWKSLEPTPRNEQSAHGWEAGARASKTMAWDERLQAGKTNYPDWSDDDLIPLINAQARFNVAIFQHDFASVESSWQAAVQNIQPPTLLITGEPIRGAYVTDELAKKIVSTWRAGERAHIPEAGHCINRYQFQPFIEIVQTFLHAHP